MSNYLLLLRLLHSLSQSEHEHPSLQKKKCHIRRISATPTITAIIATAKSCQFAIIEEVVLCGRQSMR